MASASLPRLQVASNAVSPSLARRAAVGASASRPARRRTSCWARPSRSKAARADHDRLGRAQRTTLAVAGPCGVIAVACDRPEVELGPVEPGEGPDPIALGRRTERFERVPRNAAVADPECRADVVPRLDERPRQPNGLRRRPGSTARPTRSSRPTPSSMRPTSGLSSTRRSSATLSTRNGATSGWKLVTPSRSHARAPTLARSASPARTFSTSRRS